MTLVTISTVKGAPGGSTVALLLAQGLAAGSSGQDSFLVECDLAGGDLAPRLGLLGVPGLASLALAARLGITKETLLAHAQYSNRAPGLSLLVGIAGPEQGIALGWLLNSLAEVLSDQGVRGVADLGRLVLENDPNETFRRRAAANIVVTSDNVASLLHARAAIESTGRLGTSTSIVVVGRRVRRLSEVEEAIGSSVIGSVRFDEDALNELLRPYSQRAAVDRARRLLSVLGPSRISTDPASGLRRDISQLIAALEPVWSARVSPDRAEAAAT